MSNKPMQWTSEYPTQPGAYWLRNYRFRTTPYKSDTDFRPEPRMVEVNAPHSDFYYFGIETAEDRRMLVSAEWYGPLFPPE